MYFTNVTNEVTTSVFADREHKLGEYIGKAYAAVVADLYSYDGLTLRSITDNKGTHYELTCDGEVYSKFTALKTALTYFMDLTGLTQKKLVKAKCAA